MRATLAWGLVCGLLLAACGDDDGGGAVETITQLIGPSGGTVELSSGGKVEIPAGALDEDTEITITKLNDSDVTLPDNLEAAGKPYAFKPHGLMFTVPVKIELPYTGSDLDVRPIKRPNEDPSDATMWTTVAPNEKDEPNNKVSGEVMSFSVMIAARPNRNSGVITLPDGAIDDGSMPDGGGGVGGDAGSAGSAGSGAIDGGGSGGTGGSGGGGGAAFYPNHGAAWNDYVVAGNDGPTTATDVACNAMTDGPGYDACTHGGEMRAIDIDGHTSCTGLMIHDSLDAFDWTCVAGNPVRAVSTGLRTGRYLSDLIDFAVPAWRENFITVSDLGENVVFTSTPAVWWSNPVVADNDGMAVGDSVSGTIYVVTQDVTADYAISSSKTSFVVQPGFEITPVVGQYASLYLGDPNNSNPIDFNWIEGTVNGLSASSTGVSGNEHRFSMLRHITVMPPLGTGFSVFCAKSKIVDFQSYDTQNGMTLNAAECTVDGARIENTAAGIRIGQIFSAAATGPNTIQNTIIEGSDVFSTGQTGITTHAQMPGTTLRNVSIYNQRGIAIEVNGSGNVLEQILVQDTQGHTSDGIVISGPDNRLDGISIHGGTNRGIVVGYAGNSIRNAQLSRQYSWAIDLQQAYETTIGNVTISRGGGGIRLYNAYRNKIWNVMIGNVGDPIYGSGTGLETTFTGGTGSEGYRADNVISGMYIVNTGLMGFSLNGSQSNVYQHMTIANSGHENMLDSAPNPVSYGGRGIRFGSSYCKGNRFNGLLLLNNADSGLDINPHITGTAIDWVEGTSFHNLAVLHNGKRSYGSLFGHDIGTGIRLGEFAVDVRFTGMLLLANNGIDPDQNCHVFSDSTVKTEAGLTDSSVNFTCAPVGGSTATLDTSATSYGALGPIQLEDVANQADSAGYAAFSTIGVSDWTRFDHIARAWGPDSSAFPDASNWGICRSAGACRLYDWSLSSADTEVRAVLPLQSGNVLTHTFWAQDATECGGVPATWNGSACRATFLSNATELMEDGVGNDNLLCESNETCVDAPNIGAYQGHGNLVTVGPYASGAVTGVTLMRHQDNGR